MLNPRYFKNWPAGTSPREVGTRVAENYLARQFEYQQGKTPVCHLSGGVCRVRLSHHCRTHQKQGAQEISFFKSLKRFGVPKAKNTSPRKRTLTTASSESFRCNCICRPGNRSIWTLGRNLADQQWAKTTPDGITAEARYWIDDMYMITAVQVQAYRATRDTKYIDRAALTMAAYLDKLQQPNGLFLSRSRLQILLGPWRRLGSGRHGRTASLAAKETSEARPHHGRLSENDGRSS